MLDSQAQHLGLSDSQLTALPAGERVGGNAELFRQFGLRQIERKPGGAEVEGDYTFAHLVCVAAHVRLLEAVFERASIVRRDNMPRRPDQAALVGRRPDDLSYRRHIRSQHFAQLSQVGAILFQRFQNFVITRSSDFYHARLLCFDHVSNIYVEYLYVKHVMQFILKKILFDFDVVDLSRYDDTCATLSS